MIQKPVKCPLCNYTSLSIIENNTINNPFIARCNNYHCRKIIYMRQNTFLDEFPRTPASLILYILKLWLIDEKNATEIYKNIKENIIESEISQDKINKILEKIRFYIGHYIKDQYSLEEFSIAGNHDYYAVDESEFVNLNNNLLWVVGIINTRNKKIRLEVTFVRNADTLKKIVTKHVKVDNILVTDQWPCYIWINYPNSGYIHSVHNHGHDDFCRGLESTSNIEQ